jgi:hypothetical protein
MKRWLKVMRKSTQTKYYAECENGGCIRFKTRISLGYKIVDSDSSCSSDSDLERFKRKLLAYDVKENVTIKSFEREYITL